MKSGMLAMETEELTAAFAYEWSKQSNCRGLNTGVQRSKGPNELVSNRSLKFHNYIALTNMVTTTCSYL